MDKIVNKYLQVREEKQDCAHCHKAQPMKGKTVCAGCSKELESFRNKKSKNQDKEGGKKG